MSTLHGGMNASTVMSVQVVFPGTRLAYQAKMRTILPQKDCTQLAAKVGLPCIVFHLLIFVCHVCYGLPCATSRVYERQHEIYFSLLLCAKHNFCQISWIVRHTIPIQMSSQEAVAHHILGGG